MSIDPMDAERDEAMNEIAATETLRNVSRNMDDMTFRINSLQDAETFETFLNKYCSRTCGSRDTIPAGYFATLFHYTRDHRLCGKLLAAAVDLELTYIFMMRDSLGAAGVWNQAFSPGHPNPTSVLDRFDSFAGKIDILYNLAAFAFRCRSFWDKFMGILFLLYDEDNYESFVKAKSRKKYFKERAGSWSSLSPHIRQCLTKVYGDIVSVALKRGIPDRAAGPPLSREVRATIAPVFPQDLVRLIDALDDIRTAEAHGTGTLRKWSLAMLPLDESRDFSLLNHWNIANSFMHNIRRVLLDRTTTPTQRQGATRATGRGD